MKNPISTYTAEFIGTLLLVLIGCGSAVIAGKEIGFGGISMSFGFTLIALMYTVGPVSGCHVNPAVTIGMWLAGRFKAAHVLPYIIAQLLGGIAGAYILLQIAMGKQGFVLDDTFALTGFGPHSPHGYSMISIALIESILTGFLVLSVLATTAKGFAVGSEALVVGMTLLVIHLIGIPASNGSFNIARSLGPAIVSMHFGALSQLIHLAGFQFAGVLMALAIHKVIHEPR